jgi:hypothetical protein
MRLAFHIALIISILYCPWWTGAIIIIAACMLVDDFYEAVLYGIAMDVLYGTSLGFHGFRYAATVYSCLIFSFSSLIRTRLAW